MEFIDPQLKQKRRKRLIIGYILLSILVGFATYILIATAMGYHIFQRDGQVIQNGIIFLDSKPTSSDIYLNGTKESEKTDVRLTLPEAEYEIILKLDGYKDWTKRLTLEGGKVLFVNYPRLFPEKLSTSELKSYLGDGRGFFTQSPDRRWILYQPNSLTTEFNVIDTTQTSEPQQVASIPLDLIGASPGKIGRLEIVEWASDNKHFLLKHVSQTQAVTFSIIDREDLAKSINLNKLFNVEPTKVSLLDGKVEKAYLYFATGGLLRIGDIKSKAIGEQLFDQILDYKPIGSDRLIYATTKNSTSGNVTVNATDGDKVFLVGTVAYDPNGQYHLEAGQYDGDWYYAIGSDKYERVSIYRNPQNFINSNNDKTPNVLLSLKMTTPLKLSFSSQKRFIMVQGTNSFSVYDTDTKQTYKTLLPQTLDPGTSIKWMDDFLVQYTLSGKIFIAEFDGRNAREMVSVKAPYSAFADGDFGRLYSLKEVNGVVVSELTELTVTD